LCFPDFDHSAEFFEWFFALSFELLGEEVAEGGTAVAFLWSSESESVEVTGEWGGVWCGVVCGFGHRLYDMLWL